MKKSRQAFFAFFAIVVALSSCRLGIPSQELDNFRARTDEWATIIQISESNFGGVTERHESFVGLLEDTTAFQTQQKIKSDSTLQFQIGQLKGNYEKLRHKHIYNLKVLRIWMEESNSWINTINYSGTSSTNAQKNWDSRQARFMRLKAKVDESSAAFDELAPAYQAIRASVLP